MCDNSIQFYRPKVKTINKATVVNKNTSQKDKKPLEAVNDENYFLLRSEKTQLISQ